MLWLLWTLVIINLLLTFVLLMTIGYVYNYAKEVAKQVGGHLSSHAARITIVERFLIQVFRLPSGLEEAPAEHAPTMKN